MPLTRASGVLAHPTSFPGNHGVGDLGDGAYRFIDWLHAADQRYWQIMPLVPVGPGNSPYASVSAFAGNPLLISLEALIGDGLLAHEDLADCPVFDLARVDFDGAREYKERKLRLAHDRFRGGRGGHLRDDLEAFRATSPWVAEFSLFMAAKDRFHEAGWTQWEHGIAFRTPEGLASWRVQLGDTAAYHEFVQFIFRRQWRALRAYANERGIRIIGDIPIFVAHDSADVWSNQRLFRLLPSGAPAVVAGVPPDYFSVTGQLWGNPHYDWQAMAAEGFGWWVDRFKGLLDLVDVIRIDHFRGFAAAWVVPSDAPTAASGRWEQGPGRALFNAITDALGDVPIIVEDLGLITADVHELRRELGLPGMAVLQFAFGGETTNAYLPHNFQHNIVVYPGTHDNQTTVGWFSSIDQHTRAHVQTYLGRDGSDIAWDFIRLASQSVADLAIFSLQDVLRLGDEARINTPGTAEGNWTWRFRTDQLDYGLADGLANLTRNYGRADRERPPSQPDPFDYTAPNAEHPLHR